MPEGRNRRRRTQVEAGQQQEEQELAFAAKASGPTPLRPRRSAKMASDSCENKEAQSLSVPQFHRAADCSR